MTLVPALWLFAALGAGFALGVLVMFPFYIIARSEIKRCEAQLRTRRLAFRG